MHNHPEKFKHTPPPFRFERMDLTANERVVWDKGWQDGVEYMRQIYVQNGYSARNIRVSGCLPSEQERHTFWEQAEVRLGPFTDKENEIYDVAFNNACLGGYPPRDA